MFEDLFTSSHDLSSGCRGIAVGGVLTISRHSSLDSVITSHEIMSIDFSTFQFQYFFSHQQCECELDNSFIFIELSKNHIFKH